MRWWKKWSTSILPLDEPAPGVFRALVPFDLSHFSRACRVLLWYFAAYELFGGDMKKKETKIKKYNAISLLLSLFSCLCFIPITSSLSFLVASSSSSSSPSVSHLLSRYYSFSLSLDFIISFPLSRSLYQSLYLAHSPYSLWFYRVALLLAPVRSFPPAVFSYP